MDASLNPLDNVALVERLDRLQAEIGSRQREALRIVAELDRRESYEADGCHDMAQWLAGNVGISNWTGRRWVNAAHRLESLPAISTALETGTLGLDKTVELTRIATPATEAGLLKWARRVSVATVKRAGDKQEVARDVVEDGDRWRRLRFFHYDDGTRMGLEGYFPAAQGAAIEKAIRRVAGRLPDTSAMEGWPEGLEPDPEGRFEKRCADALWALCSQSIADDAVADRATVVAHIAIDALGGITGELDGGPVLHKTTCERLSCDSRLQFVLTDRDGDALGIGDASRTPPGWLEREVRYRDHYCCTFPGCNQKAYLQSHHIEHWLHKGPTELGNLITVCFFHHKLLHEYRWSVALVGSVTEWFKPSGHRYEPGRGPPVPAA
jgi:uncharacterized protein DUF222